MSCYRRGCLYIRRIKPTDRADTIMMSIRMAAMKMLAERRKGSAYVLVRHGFSRIIQVDSSKASLKSSIHFAGERSWKQGARRWRERLQPSNPRQGNQAE